jgi:hypothetical protein
VRNSARGQRLLRRSTVQLATIASMPLSMSHAAASTALTRRYARPPLTHAAKTLCSQAMDPITLIVTALLSASGRALAESGLQLARSVLKVAREPILLAGLTLLLILSGITSLLLSGLVFRGWWQEFFLELGVGLIVVSIVEVAVLGVLHALTDGKKLREILDATNRIENELMGHSIITASGGAVETAPAASGGSTPSLG